MSPAEGTDPNGCGGAHGPAPLTIVRAGGQRAGRPGDRAHRRRSGPRGGVPGPPGLAPGHHRRSSILLFTVGVIYLDRDGYRDGDEVGLSLLDSIYYATVTLSTTGYGDITPITPGARLVNILLITPLRITFLLVLIGTTLEALTARSREEFRIRRWRSRVRQHVIVCGYGTKGRSAIRSLQANGTPLDKIVVVDPNPGPSTRPTPSA